MRLSERLSGYAQAHRTDDHHRVGGFWNYSYVIARDLLDRDIDGVRFAGIQPSNEKIQYLEDTHHPLSPGFLMRRSRKLNLSCSTLTRRRCLSGYLRTSISMVRCSTVLKTRLTSSRHTAMGSICRLTNDIPYDKERISLFIGVGMLGHSFSNRLPVGASEPTMYVSVPITVEMGLRYIGHGIRGRTNRIYFRLIPDHFYTPVLSHLFSRFLSVFNGECQTNVRALALDILSWDAPQYELLVRDLISSQDGRTSCGMLAMATRASIQPMMSSLTRIGITILNTGFSGHISG